MDFFSSMTDSEGVIVHCQQSKKSSGTDKESLLPQGQLRRVAQCLLGEGQSPWLLRDPAGDHGAHFSKLFDALQRVLIIKSYRRLLFCGKIQSQMCFHSLDPLCSVRLFESPTIYISQLMLTGCVYVCVCV